MTLGQILRSFRERAGLSQTEVANRMNRLSDQISVTKQHVSKWETDNNMPSLLHAAALSLVLRVPLIRICEPLPLRWPDPAGRPDLTHLPDDLVNDLLDLTSTPEGADVVAELAELSRLNDGKLLPTVRELLATLSGIPGLRADDDRTVRMPALA